VILLLLLLLAAAVAFGVWRRFTAIEWIWTFFALSIGMLIIWFLMVVFIVGPEMRRMTPGGGG
jgi:hypothetical protein